MAAIKPEQKNVSIGDTSIDYLYYPGDGPTLIFLHATGFMPGIWHPIAREFAGTCNVMAPYFCDHRAAEPEDGGLSWLQLAEDIALFCKTLGIDTPFMVGHSMGGAVITLAAGKFGVKPRKMVLIEPIFLPSQLYNLKMRVEDHPLAGKSIRRKNGWADLDEAKAYLRSKPLFARWDDEMLEMYLNYGFVPSQDEGVTLACHPRREASLFMGSMAYDPWPLMSGIECPVLLLEGETSENRPFIDLQKAAGRFPNGRYRLVEAAGHLIPMEKPTDTTALIREFFDFR